MTEWEQRLTDAERTAGENLTALVHQMSVELDLYTHARAALHEAVANQIPPEDCTIDVLRALWYAHNGGEDVVHQDEWAGRVWMAIERTIHEIHRNAVERDLGRGWSVPRFGGKPEPTVRYGNRTAGWSD